MGSQPVGVPIFSDFLTRWVSRLLGLALVSWALAVARVHRLYIWFIWQYLFSSMFLVSCYSCYMICIMW